MSLLVIGLSHHTAPLTVLESLVEDPARDNALAGRIMRSATVDEVVVLSTCNRLEVYAEVAAFHPAVAAIGEALAEAAALPGQSPRSPLAGDEVPKDPDAELAVRADTLAEHLYVRFDDSAVAHTFTVACGLDSMAVGESQILGQIRDSLALAQEHGRAGESLNALFQQALRVGKRAHSETDIDGHSISLVQAGLEEATARLGVLAGRRAAIVGAGGMSGLAAATLARADVADVTIVNRTPDRAARLAQSSGGRARPWADLADVLADSDLVIACTGATDHVITGADLLEAAARRGDRPQVVIDLALPRDVEPVSDWEVALPSVTLLSLQDLGELLSGRADGLEVAKVRDLVTVEVAGFVTRRVEKSVAPTVAALRARAAEVVAAEMGRLDRRLPDLDTTARAEMERAVHRIVGKLLHTPTRRVKEFAMEGSGPDYASVLRELFDLEPMDVANVASPPKRVTS
jgi:glutamyl-tRNA reductase